MKVLRNCLAAFLLLSVCSYFGLSWHYTSQIDRIQRLNCHAIAAAEQDFSDEVKALEDKHRLAIESAWGNPFAVAIKDPSNTIAEMLQNASDAVAPELTPLVAVDDFTAFDLRLLVSGNTSLTSVTHFAQQVLPDLGQYLHSVTIVMSNEIVGVIDKYEIDHFDDWRTASNGILAVIEGNWKEGRGDDRN